MKRRTREKDAIWDSFNQNHIPKKVSSSAGWKNYKNGGLKETHRGKQQPSKWVACTPTRKPISHNHTCTSWNIKFWEARLLKRFWQVLVSQSHHSNTFMQTAEGTHEHPWRHPMWRMKKGDGANPPTMTTRYALPMPLSLPNPLHMHVWQVRSSKRRCKGPSIPKAIKLSKVTCGDCG